MKKSFWQKAKQESGVAMLIAISTIAVLGVLISELVYQAEIYRKVVHNTVDELQAKYLAEGALRLARLQIHAANKASNLLKNAGGAGGIVSQNDINQIWQLPLILPPPIPDGVGLNAKITLEKFRKELKLPGTISISITGESSKLNINRIVWKLKKKKKTNNNNSNNNNNNEEETQEDPLQKIRSLMIQTLENLLSNKKNSSEEFANKYPNLTGEILFKHILAWMDPKTQEDGDGDPKEAFYADLDTPYSIKNAPLSSLSELNMIKGFDDEVANLFSSNFTTLQTEGININSVDFDLLKALIPNLTEEAEGEIQVIRSEKGGFKDTKEFWNILTKFGINTGIKDELERKGIVFVTKETAFRVIIEAKAGDAKKAWLAHIGLLPPELEDNKENPEEEEETQDNQDDANQNNEQENTNNDKNNSKKDSKEESSPYDNIAPPVVYLKTE